jgi:hypothetical protein
MAEVREAFPRGASAYRVAPSIVPATAETHSRGARRFVVAPAHLDGVVVDAADRFFVVELRGGDVRRPAGEAS